MEVSDRIGEEGRGFRYLFNGLNAERVFVVGESIDIGRAALRRRLHQQKSGVDRFIGKNQGMAFPLALAATQLDAVELTIRKGGTQSGLAAG